MTTTPQPKTAAPDAPHRPRHTRRLVLHYLEMVVAMAVGMVALWAGTLSPGGLMLWGHVLMLVAMALRRSEYAHCWARADPLLGAARI